jgi:hypothetical protein
MIGNIEIGKSDVLLVVDIQNDFCGGGALAVPRADEIVPLLNRLARVFEHVVLTQDWHPPGHHSFASTHKGRRPFETIEASYGPQILWPDHCVQGTRGAEIHAALDIPHAELILRKGFHPQIDSYSASSKTTTRLPQGWLDICANAASPASTSQASRWIFAFATPPRTPIGAASVLSCWRMPAGQSILAGLSRKPGTLLQLSVFAASATHWEDRDPGRRERGGASPYL